MANLAREQSSTPNVDKLPDSVKAQAVDAARPAAQLMEKATSHRQENPNSQPGHGDATREALIRNQGGQGKEQAAMSPSDHGKQAATQQRSQSRGRSIER